MICQILLLLSSVICYIHLQSDVQLSSEILEFREKLKTLCPHSRFCDDRNDDVKLPFQTPTSDMSVKPCCASCSCSKECGRKRNCCTYDRDIYKLDETLDTVCKQLQPHAESNYYHIIDKCPNRSENCRLFVATGREQFRPMYSNENGMIYFNKACSDCHAQRNLTAFKEIVTCEHVYMSYFSAIKSIYDDQRNDGCALNFIPSNDIDISSALCYPFKIKTCDVKTNHPEELRYLCQRFNATFHANHYVYNNVFCFLCNIDRYHSSELIRKYEYCPVLGFHKLIRNVKLTVILDKAFKTEAVNDGVKDVRFKFPEWCTRVGYMTSCRILFCPEGQEYLAGSCKQIAKRWYFKRLRMVVKLENTDTNRQNVFQYENGMNESSLVLERPGFEEWDYTLFYNLETDEKTIGYFVAFLTYTGNSVLPTTLITDIERSFGLRWKLHHNKTIVALKPIFNKFTTYKHNIILNKEHIAPAWYDSDPFLSKPNESNFSEYIIKFLTGNKYIFEEEENKETIFLTKLFFCNLIELNEDDYIYEVFIIHLVDGNRTLGDGEYTWARNEAGAHKIRICAEDMERRDVSNAKLLQTFKTGLILNIWLIFCIIYIAV